MPPKAQPGKKGKDDQEDYSDVHTLPPINTVVSTLLLNSFFSAVTREKLQKTLTEKLPLEAKIKVLSRDDLIAYAKLKQIMVEPNVAATLPQDDPRLKMTEAEQLSKAACDKMFELSVLARRAKKEKIQKQEEEAKLQQQVTGETHLDSDNLDLIFNLVDFPQTKAEALAMAKYNMTVNCVVDIKQALKQPQTEEEVEELEQQEHFTDELTEGNDNLNSEKISQKLVQLKEARDASVKKSPLRFMYVQDLEFVNWPDISYKVNDLGEEIEERKEPEQVFLSQLVQKLDYIGSLLVKYQRFREKVPTVPLMPDQQALQMIENLKQESEEYNQWLQECDLTLTLNQSQKSLNDTNQEEQELKEQRKIEMQNEKQSRAQEETERKNKIQELRANLKVSLDDNKDYSNFNLDTYNRDFIQNKESKNCISSIMTAMVTQISNGDQHYQSFHQEDQHNQSTEADTIDDLFDDLEKEVAYDIQVNKRPAVNHEDQQYDKKQTYFNRERKKGTQAFAHQTTIIGEVEYHDESDKSKLPLYKLPKEVNFHDEEKAEDICIQEKKVLENLVLPGFNRHMMPQVPSKSQRIRDSEKPGLYPFSTLPIEDAERALIQKAFQELLKSNFIDEGQSSDTKHTKYKAFERCFQQHLNPEILRQVMAEALLKEPDMATLYYPRNDQLLVALYNKIKNIQKKEGEVHGEREWKAAYRVMPDFENWIKFFSDELIIPMQQNTVQSTTNLKYQMDDEMIPDQMIDIDDKKIQNIVEKSQMFYPQDGSILKVDSYNVGGQTYKKSVVYKDNLTLGLRKSQPDESVPEEEQEYGLYSLKKEGDVEFWLNFENDTKLLVESVKYVKNPQRLIRIDPPKPTPEEIAAREEAIKQAQILAAKNKNKKDQAQFVVEEYKEPEPTWEPEPLDFLDSVFTDEFLHSEMPAAQVTTTLANGLIVKHLADGNIVQIKEDQIFDHTIEEKDRIIMRNSAVVVRHFRNRDAEVLFPNGETARFNKQDMLWTITNNKGKRVAKQGGISWDLEPIPCATETDAVTNAKMMIREDKVMTIQFKDGSLYCQHADGTLMKTSANGNEIRIEKEGFAPVTSKRGLRVENSFDDIQNSQRNIWVSEERAILGYLMKTFLPDGTVVETFFDVLLKTCGVRHLFIRPDFTIVSIDSTGQVDIISSNARSALNEQYGRNLMGQDKDYCRSLYHNEESINCFGVYHAFLIGSAEREAGIFTVDENYKGQYVINGNLELIKVQNKYLQYGTPEEVEALTQRSNLTINDNGNDLDLEDIGGYKNPLTKHFIFPRLFVINSDGSGFEMLTKQQLEYYFRIAKHREDSLKQRRSVMVGTTLSKTHYFVTQIKNMQDFDIMNQHLKQLSFPQNAQYALLHNKEKHSKLLDQSQLPNESRLLPNQFLFRQIFEFQEFESFKQEAFYDDFNRYRQWKMSQIRYDTEFGIVHIPAKDQVLDYKKIEDDEYMSRRIITKILKERRNKRETFQADHFKRQFINQMNNDAEVTEYYKRGNTYFDKDVNDSAWRNSMDGNQNQIEKQQQLKQMKDSVNMEKIRNIKKKQESYVQNSIQEIRRMINTPAFINNYFVSKEGQMFTKNNPQKPPSQEMIMRMSQRITRSQHNTDNAQSQYEGNSQRGEDTSPLQNDGQNQQQVDEEEGKESPIVALEPDDQYNKNGSNFMGSKKMMSYNEANGGTQPSLYVQEKMYMKQKEQESLLKAEEYHVVKTKDFNVVGRLRQEKPFIKSIQKSQAQSELNEKFITTECIADRRVKISSMAPRQYMHAPSIEEVRKQGQHQMILSAINKKQTFADLINQANSMVTSVLHDPLKRTLNIMPSALRFGIVQAEGGAFELLLTLKNEDSVAQRVTVKPMNDKRIQVLQIETGPIAPGMTRKISVTVRANEECNIKETLQILTKTDIFKIPIEASFLSAENYQKEYQEQRALSGKGLANSRVRNRLNDSIQRGRMSAKGERAGGVSIDNGSDEDTNGGRQPNWIETTQSDSKLPQIPKNNQRPFEVDPKKNLQELLKK